MRPSAFNILKAWWNDGLSMAQCLLHHCGLEACDIPTNGPVADRYHVCQICKDLLRTPGKSLLSEWGIA